MTSLEHDFLFDLTQKIVQKAISTRTDVETLSRLISQEQEQEVRDETIFCVLEWIGDQNLVNLRGYRELLWKLPKKFVSIKTFWMRIHSSDLGTKLS